MFQANSLLEVVRLFQDENVCRQYLAQIRWGGKPRCPKCEGNTVYALKNGKQYKCRSCDRKFSVIVGTVFENTKLPLSKWMIAAYLLTSNKKGISSLQLARHIQVTQKTAWFMLHRIREMIKNKSLHMLRGTVEVDETFVGGKNKNRHYNKRKKNIQGRSWVDKTPVLGMLQRGGKVISMSVPDVTINTLCSKVIEHVQAGNILMTDEWSSYKPLENIYDHRKVEHGRGQYVNGNTHTNTIEGYWSHVKRTIFGTYHLVSRKHMDRYCGEFDFRYNYRAQPDFMRFNFAMIRCIGRLKYKDLVPSK